jgi:outer membrane protein OmpA-like peptidoglycan-associated protein
MVLSHLRLRLPGRILATATLAFALAASSIALAGDVSLTAVTFPDKTSIDIPLARTAATPAKAKADASVKFADGQARVRVSFKAMEPAILFGGDISSYVVWVVTRDGVAENLGELIVNESNDSGAQDYSTGKKQFAIMITAEPYYLVGKPTALVLFTSAAADTKKTQSSPFSFGGFRPGPKYDYETIAGLTYKDKTPVALRQAEKALAIAEANGAAAVSPKAIEDAKIAFAQATNSTKSGGSPKAVTDYSRRTVTLVAESMREVGRKRDAEAAAEEAARRKAETDALTSKATTAEAARAQTEMTLTQVEAARQALAADKAQLEKEKRSLAGERDALAADKARLEKDKTAIAAERDALARRLTGSMAMIMETRETARGAVMSLPGISFDTGRATLRPTAQLTLAKLAGLALVFPNINMRVEGFTDSTGKAETNRKLSEARAKTVSDFLKSQGVAETRLGYQGLGASNPVADNATKEGRAKNRRVEIVAAEGEIKAVAAD